MDRRICALLLVVFAAHGCSGRQPETLKARHSRALQQTEEAGDQPAEAQSESSVNNPGAEAINQGTAAATTAASDATGQLITPGFYINATTGTLTLNQNLDVNVPLGFSCCNISFSNSGGLTNATIYAYSQTGTVFPIAWPGWTGQVTRIGNNTFGAAAGNGVNGIQFPTWFFGDRVVNESSTPTDFIQTDWIAASAQLKPGTIPAGLEAGNKYFNYYFKLGDISPYFAGTGTPVPNGVPQP